jgi:2-methylisocitrate lyase-like PEP mutase family enzyme
MTTRTENAQHAARMHFRELHAAGCFVMPNAWDVGTAKALYNIGFPAVASTSSGHAWSTGKADHEVTLAETLSHFEEISRSVPIPINGDFEAGFAIDADAVAANVAKAAAAGIAGLSIEDATTGSTEPLLDLNLSVERVRAAREALGSEADSVVLTARSEGFLVGQPDLDATIKRLRAYAAAGADCLYAPGITDREDIRAIVEAVAPKPVNVLVFSNFTSVAELADIGVRRISVGGALARAAWASVLAAAHEMLTTGTFGWLERASKGADVQRALTTTQRFTSR